MLEKLKGRLKDFLRDEPGSRFQDRYHRVQKSGSNILRKILFMGGGSVVAVAGVFFLPAPGPGMVIIAVGLGMIAQESLAMARALDWLEVHGRRAWKKASARWRSMPVHLRISLVAAVLVVTAGLAFASYKLLLG